MSVPAGTSGWPGCGRSSELTAPGDRPARRLRHMDARVGRLLGIFATGLVLVILLRGVISLVWGAFTLLMFVLAVFAIADVLTSRRALATKAVWVVGILIFPLLGPVTYWLLGRQPAQV